MMIFQILVKLNSDYVLLQMVITLKMLQIVLEKEIEESTIPLIVITGRPVDKHFVDSTAVTHKGPDVSDHPVYAEVSNWTSNVSVSCVLLLLLLLLCMCLSVVCVCCRNMYCKWVNPGGTLDAHTIKENLELTLLTFLSPSIWIFQHSL